MGRPLHSLLVRRVGGQRRVLGLSPGNPRLFEALVERARVGAFLTDERGACVYANARLCELAGRSAGEMRGYGWRKAVHPDDLERLDAAWASAQQQGSSPPQDFRFLGRDGSVVWLEVSASAVRDADGGLVGWAGVCVDVSEGRASERRYRDLVENARDAIYSADLAGNFTAVNHAAEQLSGYARAELLGMNFFDLIDPGDAEAAQAALARSLGGAEEPRIELRLRGKYGRAVHVEVSGRLVEEYGTPVRFEGIARDVSEQRLLREQLHVQAFHDALTGLANRALLLDRLRHALGQAARRSAPVAVILLDLDNFKLLNDSLGHDRGDELLRAVAERLQQEAPAADTVARLGGDEFALVIENLQGERQAVEIAQRIASALRQPLETPSGTHRIAASLGIALAQPGDEPASVLRNADTAMYAAKAAKNGGVELFDDGMRNRLLRELELKNALADALHDGELRVHYQPIVSLESGETIAVEALVRWLHPQWGWVQPSEFIPIAEADDLILRIGGHVLSEAIQQAARWHHQTSTAAFAVSVNVAARQLAAPDFADLVLETLGRHRLPPGRLGLEITERAFVDTDDRHIADNLTSLANAGIHLALDDFGTGYSALASLNRFPLTALKIDRLFIAAIKTATDPAPVTRAIISLANALELTVIAEGVETRTQADYLHRLGCTAAQGYLYARPQPATALDAILADQAPRQTKSVSRPARQRSRSTRPRTADARA